MRRPIGTAKMKRTLALVAALSMSLVGFSPAHSATTAPTGVDATRVTPTDVPKDDATSIVSWDAQAGAASYQVRAEADGQSTVFGGAASCNDGSCESTVSGLQGGVEYTITVTAFPTDSSEEKSSVISHIPHSAPAEPVGLNATSSSEGIVLSWTIYNLEEAGGQAVNGMSIRDPQNGTEFAVTQQEAEAGEITLNLVERGLQEGETYSFTLSASNIYGESPQANFNSVSTLSTPAAPDAPSLVASGSNLTVTWTALAAQDNGGSDVTSYRVFLLSGGTQVGSARTTDSQTTTTEYSDLADGTYTVQVAAVSAVGTGDRSPASSAVTIGSSYSGGGGGGGGGGAIGAAPIVETAPYVFGENAAGSELTVNPGVWDSEEYQFAYQWYACEEAIETPTQLQVLLTCNLIPGQTSQTFLVTEDFSSVHLLAAVIATGASYTTTTFTASIAPGENVEGELPDDETVEEPASDAATSTGYWTKRNGDNVKLYAKNVIGLGKVQFFMNGEEIAWIRAEDETDPKLRVITEGHMKGATYLVRDRDLPVGKNVFEIYLNGERIERRVASR